MSEKRGGRIMPRHSSARVRAEWALTNALKGEVPSAEITCDRVRRLRDNLVPGTELRQFAADFCRGAGGELRDKIRAPFSSSALAVNTFARFKLHEAHLSIGGHVRFKNGSLEFEKQCSTGLGGTPPHLDIMITGEEHTLAIESKCTEHLSRKEAYFSDSYERLVHDRHQSKPWIEEMMEIRRGGREYFHLNAAQLVKHAFGLAKSIGDGFVTLLYLYWEPTNPTEISEVGQHSSELQEFETRVSGGLPRFQAMTYRQLWAQWAKMDHPIWLRGHVSNLRKRYEVPI